MVHFPLVFLKKLQEKLKNLKENLQKTLNFKTQIEQ